jgi:reactive intermediate/imine deaminase
MNQEKVRESMEFGVGQGVPPQVGPFSHATKWGDLLFVTGQMPTIPESGELIAGDVIAQTQQVMRNLDAVVTAAGGQLANALMVRVYLTNFADFDRFNSEYVKWFAEPRPSRTCVGVSGLAVGALVEIDLIIGLANGDRS